MSDVDNKSPSSNNRAQDDNLNNDTSQNRIENDDNINPNTPREEEKTLDDRLQQELENKLKMTSAANNNQKDINSSESNQTDTPNINNTSDVSINAQNFSSNNTPTSTPLISTLTTPSKIEILLKAVGNAPILKNKKFLLERTKNVHYIVNWLKKYMKLEPKDQLFLYVNQEFAPSPDAEIGTIYDCFKIGNTVIFHYCITPAWG